ncbi:MAG: GTP cyclohydrolase I FolE [Candidatus Longimicrobiales bacterium M2_2A_002]
MGGEMLRVVKPRGGRVEAHPNGNGNGSGGPRGSAGATDEDRGGRSRATPSSGVDMARIEAGVREILAGLGEDVSRDGLADTPARVARAYREILAGMREDAAEHLGRVFPQEQSGDDVVMLRNIQFTSLCEHHMLPFTGVAHVAYLPSHGRVTGLSKLARTVDVFARRLQMQERLTGQVADALVEHLDPRGVVVVVEAEHSCLRLRGAKKDDARMVTTAFRGALAEDRALRAEVLSLMGVGR